MNTKPANSASNKDSVFLNEFHKQRFELAKILESQPSKSSLDECIAQYHRIKNQSTRRRERQDLLPQANNPTQRPSPNRSEDGIISQDF